MSAGIINNEKELLRQTAKGNEKAFRLLFDAWHNRLYFYILQLTGSKEQAEDITQDTFLKIWLQRHQLPQVEHFNAWIFRIARNSVFTVLRRKATEATILDKKLQSPEPEPEPDELLHIKLVKQVLQKAVDSLPGQQQKVYRLRREEGLHIKEVASLLNISEVTVKRHLTQAQKTLREALDNAFPFESGILLIIFGLLHP